MIGESPAAADQPFADEDIFQAAASLAARGEYGTMVLDGIGRIRSCGTVARLMLGRSLGDLVGTPISEFVSNFTLSESSWSYSARYLAHLCAEGGWRKFDAVDVNGQEFAIELSLSRVMTDGQDLFLLNLRRLQPG